MNVAKIFTNKYVKSVLVTFAVALFIEIFWFNFSSWKSRTVEPVVLGQNVTTDEELSYYTEVYTLDGPAKNVDVDLDVENHDLAYVSVMLTDEGDKYEYSTPEYTVCNGIRRSGFCNIYPFDDAHTVQVKVRVDEGCIAHIRSITVNARIPIDIKPIRLLVVFGILFFGYLIYSQSAVHEIYFDTKKTWQLCVTLAVMLGLIFIGLLINRADRVMMQSPWPHHSQYQELARSLEMGTVELTEQYVDPAILEVENPYDTIMLQAEGISYSMDYAFYDGHYYAYFGIIPELMFYYPYHMIKGGDLPNYKAMYIFYVMLVTGVFLSITGIVRRYIKSIPYLFYIMLCVGTVLSANFVYLTARADIYNIPIMGAIAFTFIGIGLWLEALNTENKYFRRLCLALGSLSMAMVAGCRPQLLLLSLIGVLLFFFENGWKERKLFTKESIIDTVCFCVPYIVIAIPVCIYNYARFGNIFDFGATYSLTTNDMNHRGFNLNRLIRSLYCYLFQPPVIDTDFPFMKSSNVDGAYMGRFLYEHMYGGMLVANTIMVSLWIGIINGLKKLEKNLKAIVICLSVSAVIIAGFDANCAGVIYRYTCDFAPAFIMAAVLLWMVYLDRGRNVIEYKFASRIAYICLVLSLAYAFLTFIASGSNVCLENDNRQLFFSIREYFRI